MGGITSGVAKRVPWRVAPDSGFEVDDPTGKGNVGIVQIDERQFAVLNAFRFSNQVIENDLVTRLVRKGKGEAEARTAVDDARTFTPREDNPTDLASIPRFLRWFEDPYGKHSLAALIHDELITGTVNSGKLRSDTLSDRFFREMMRTSGVPFLKRWIMWSAVALRTRFIAGGWRRWTVVAWLAFSVVGISIAVGAAGSLVRWWRWPWSRRKSFKTALVMLVVAGALWGRQWGASLIAAVAALWLVPAAIVTYFAYGIYLVLERIARVFGRR
ncbi:DUF1353 domain-containing protein [Gordonia jinghuaiqii]|uniref:DUF1353 domain-containing protein n=1 Tax=Gordonia jinghuaiqii TaxID=2758710 RepID=A0A7D7QGC0_9ACTN|nr:DUF1353 domain-containing protein [Gordonia jinghuaiqii]MCR5978365.1 DUF1353 domain-containing protein [Gordonia jinghuaiqii]QMT01202.1 DUF1353 domain-containing protein [Gordonia jinghuaiqii]